MRYIGSLRKGKILLHLNVRSLVTIMVVGSTLTHGGSWCVCTTLCWVRPELKNVTVLLVTTYLGIADVHSLAIDI